MASTNGIADKFWLSVLDELINGRLGIGVDKCLASGSKINSGHQVVSLIAQPLESDDDVIFGFALLEEGFNLAHHPLAEIAGELVNGSWELGAHGGPLDTGQDGEGQQSKDSLHRCDLFFTEE